MNIRTTNVRTTLRYLPALLIAGLLVLLPASVAVAAPAADAAPQGVSSLWSFLEQGWQGLLSVVTGADQAAAGDDGGSTTVEDPNPTVSPDPDPQSIGPLLDPDG